VFGEDAVSAHYLTRDARHVASGLRRLAFPHRDMVWFEGVALLESREAARNEFGRRYLRRALRELLLLHLERGDWMPPLLALARVREGVLKRVARRADSTPSDTEARLVEAREGTSHPRHV